MKTVCTGMLCVLENNHKLYPSYITWPSVVSNTQEVRTKLPET